MNTLERAYYNDHPNIGDTVVVRHAGESVLGTVTAIDFGQNVIANNPCAELYYVDTVRTWCYGDNLTKVVA